MSLGQISLREIRKSDLDLLREHRNDPATRVWLEDCREISPAQQAKWFEHGGSSGMRIAVIAAEDVGLSRISRDSAGDVALVGLDIFRLHRNKGYAKSVFNATCDAALAVGARSLALWVFLENRVAFRVYAARGFEIDETEPVKWFVRRFPDEAGAAPHAYVKMVLRS